MSSTAYFLFSVFTSTAAWSAPELGLKDKDQLVFGFSQTSSFHFDSDLLIDGAALCLVSFEQPSPANGQVSIDTFKGAPGVLADSCHAIPFRGSFVETVALYPKEMVHDSPWNKSDKSLQLPSQRTFDGKLNGYELREAYGRLVDKCGDKNCQEIRLFFLGGHRSSRCCTPHRSLFQLGESARSGPETHRWTAWLFQPDQFLHQIFR